MGFDPGSRAREDFVAEYTFLECKFRSELRLLRVSSGNISMDEDRERFSGVSEDTNINGREAIIVREPSRVADKCALDMRTNEGLVRVATVLSVEGLSRKLDRCDGIVDIAKAVEPTISEGH